MIHQLSCENAIGVYTGQKVAEKLTVKLKLLLLVILPALTLPGLAQNTCYTNSQGTTLCSNSGKVITGNTNSTGNSVYRDDRGNRLDFKTDQFGSASVQPRTGKPIQWSQPVLGERKYPDLEPSPPPPSSLAIPRVPLR